MPIISGRTLLLVLAAVISGCVVAPRPFERPVEIPLQEPPAGQAIVYLLRSPYDSTSVAVSSPEKTLVVLKGGTYTVLVLSSGKHVLSTRLSSIFGERSDVAPPIELELKPNERRFFNLSGATARTPSVAGILPVPGGGTMPLVLATLDTASGTRTWKEVTELDAQGLMSISKLVSPEKGAL